MSFTRVASAIAIFLMVVTGCSEPAGPINQDSGPLKLAYCFARGGCANAAPKGSPQEVAHLMADHLREADFQGSPQNDGSTLWTKENGTVRITKDLKGSYVEVPFQKGRVRCHEISEATTVPDPIAQIEAIKQAGHESAIAHQQWKCQAV